ncbi:MAG: hypothetical protein KAT65_09330 [Methanophagales archaeon]|nr:hypothetical protein [Methanophagales archaeon]
MEYLGEEKCPKKKSYAKGTAHNSGYPVSLSLVAPPKLFPSVATLGSRKRYIKFRIRPCDKLLNANIIGESDGT